MADITGLLCNVVNVIVLVLCTVMKVPQISKVIKAGTTQGISLNSHLMECWCFSILLAYPVANGYPLRMYLDMAILNVQDLVLLFMVAKDRNLLGVTTVSMFIGYVSVLVGAANLWIPSTVLYVMSSTVPVIGASGKIIQAVSIIRTKDAGAVSPLTWGIGACTAAGKIFVSSVLSGDKYLIFLSTQAAILNGAVCISAKIYPHKPKTQ